MAWPPETHNVQEDTMAGAATYKRVMVEIGNLKFYPIEARYSLSRNANQVGRRIGDSLQGRAFVYCDAHDMSRITQDDTMELWKMATESKDPLHKVSITYYSEDGDRVLSNVEFMGWINVFEFFNPALNGESRGASMGGVGQSALASTTGYNNVLYIELAVVLDEANVSKHKFTK
jgi:hypothetical protein